MQITEQVQGTFELLFLKWLTLLPILMQKSLRWWQFSDKHDLPFPPPPGISGPCHFLFWDSLALNKFNQTVFRFLVQQGWIKLKPVFVVVSGFG